MTTFAKLETNRIFTVQQNYTDTATPDLTFKLDDLPTATANFILHFYKEGEESTTSEWMFITSVNSGTNEVTCDNGAKRGLQFDDTNCNLTTILANTAGIEANRKPIYAGYKAEIIAHHSQLNDKASVSDDNIFSGDNTFSGDNEFTKSLKVPVFADATARDAAIPSPEDGMDCTLQSPAGSQKYYNSQWNDLGSSTPTPDASETVKGIVEVATNSEFQNGTDTGGTGAKNVAVPSQIAEAFQDNGFTYQGTDTGSANAYAISVTPNLTAYTEGQKVTFKAANGNTGASTIDIDSLGTKAIKKLNDQDLESGDIESGAIIELVYDGTNFQIQTPSATNLSAANAATLTDGSNADSLHTHTTDVNDIAEVISGTGRTYATKAGGATAAASYTAVQTFTVNSGIVGTFRVDWSLSHVQGTGTAYGRIVKNGSTVLQTQSTSSTTPQNYNVSATLAVGDTLSLEVYVSNPPADVAYGTTTIKGTEQFKSSIT